jgi:8-oxo-dGTP pyrophosphatase MutT (NUDIX family)
MPMSWKKLDSRQIYDNPWMTIYEDHVVNPGGGRNHYGHVHFKNAAIAVVPVDEMGFTWLVGQDRYTLGEYSWEVPMGGSPLGEDRLATAHRELKEETGLSAGRMTELMKVHVSNSITDEVGYIYIAEALSKGEPALEETENITARRLPFADAVGMALSGEITDALSCLALLRIERLRR